MKIIYDGGLDENLEQILTAYYKTKGYKLTDTGYFLPTKTRDMTFEKIDN